MKGKHERKTKFEPKRNLNFSTRDIPVNEVLLKQNKKLDREFKDSSFH